MLYLKKQLVFSDSLDWLDEVRGDGVGKTMSLLDFLQIETESDTFTGKAFIHLKSRSPERNPES